MPRVDFPYDVIREHLFSASERDSEEEKLRNSQFRW